MRTGLLAQRAGLLAGYLGLAVALSAAPPLHGAGEQGYSKANRLLFFSDQLQGLAPGSTLHYAFSKAQPADARFEDEIVLHLAKPAQGQGLDVRFDYLSGARSKYVPPVEGATGNPILLVFLQHDAYEMSLRSGGSARHFQNLIKQALQDAAQVDSIGLHYSGRTVAATRIRITPYTADSYRVRYPDLAEKSYEFTLADAVPGGVYELKSLVPARSGAGVGAAPSLWEDIRFTRIDPAP